MRYCTLVDRIHATLCQCNVAMHWIKLESCSCATAGYTYPWGTKIPQLIININYIEEFAESIAIWGANSDGDKANYYGTLPLL
jgi:hypothetical protein